MKKLFIFCLFFGMVFFPRSVFGFGVSPAEMEIKTHHYSTMSKQKLTVTAYEFIGGIVEFIPYGDLIDLLIIPTSTINISDSESAKLYFEYFINPKKQVDIGRVYQGGFDVIAKTKGSGGNDMSLHLRTFYNIQFIQKEIKKFELGTIRAIIEEEYITFPLYLVNKGNIEQKVDEVLLFYTENEEEKSFQLLQSPQNLTPFDSYTEENSFWLKDFGFDFDEENSNFRVEAYFQGVLLDNSVGYTTLVGEKTVDNSSDSIWQKGANFFKKWYNIVIDSIVSLFS